jgi:predicted Fe-Mo cluster-binding NifX family protein
MLGDFIGTLNQPEPVSAGVLGEVSNSFGKSPRLANINLEEDVIMEMKNDS